MFNSQMTTSDLSRSFSFKHEEDLELQKSREVMDSDLHRHHQLARLRSAPSSLLADCMDEGSKEYFPRSSSPETDIIFERFISTSASADPRDLGDKPLARGRSWQFLEADVVSQQNGFQNTPSSQMMYSSPASIQNHSSGIENSYRGVNSVGLDSGEVRSGGNCSNLIRHSSSPAGLLSNVMEGYRVMRGMPNYRAGNGPSGEVPTSTSRFKNQMSISSRETSSPALMSQLSEMVSDGLGHSSSDDGSLGNGSIGSRCYIPGFPISSWDDTPLVSPNFSGLKRDRDHINGKLISSLNPPDAQSGEAGNHPSGLAHQFSLPKTSSEMAAVENFLHLHESVPCKVRAKRGCATHPRSIAERIRRTKISERTRKLQELVPNMDKQTNTADMLDLAVDYIKDLQKQVKVLSESRARCSCSSKQKPYPNPAV